MYTNLAILTTFTFFYSIVARRMERTLISGPVVFILFGLLVGPLGLGVLDLTVDGKTFRALADLTLALVLFTHSASANRAALRRSTSIPKRMLLMGLPGVILLGFGAGCLVFDTLSLYELAILATILAATDADLGRAVITDKSVPISVREGLNLESGLNDGLCVPILLLFIELAKAHSEPARPMLLAIKLAIHEVGIGLAVGVAISALGVWLMSRAVKLGWVDKIWGKLPVIMLALSCFALAQILHGSGYIAAFSGGMLFGFITRELSHELVSDAEGAGELMSVIVWVVFGAVIIDALLPEFEWSMMIYAVLSLTVVRMVPMILSLIGTDIPLLEKFFLGWFGPRGLASLVFGVIVIHAELPGARFIAGVIVCTVFLSVLAHGVTANPCSKALASYLNRRSPGTETDSVK